MSPIDAGYSVLPPVNVKENGMSDNGAITYEGAFQIPEDEEQKIEIKVMTGQRTITITVSGWEDYTEGLMALRYAGNPERVANMYSQYMEGQFD